MAQITELKGTVYYDYQVDEDGKPIESAQSPVPELLRNRLGEDFFAAVVAVDLSGTKADDDVLGYLQELSALSRLDVTGNDRKAVPQCRGCRRRNVHLQVGR